MKSESSFAYVLGTNYAPTPSESAQIIRFCAETEAELALLQVQIDELQQTLEAVTRKRDEMQGVIDSHRALLAPMRHLPVEIIQHIFVLCLPTKRNAAMHESEAPLLLGRICRSWRNVSLNTAELWSRIHIVTHHVYDIWTHKVVLTWLGRSGDVPLKISMYVPPKSSGQDCIDAMVPYSTRWKSFDLQMSQEDMAYSDLRDTSLLSLEDFSYRDNEGVPPDDLELLEGSFSVLKDASKLRRFTLHCHIPFLLHPPWKQLTELNIVNCSATWDYDTYVQILEDCTSLEVCCFKYTSHRPHNPVQRHITLLNLRSLSVDSSVNGPVHPVSLDTVLGCLTTPNLRVLESSSHLRGAVVPIILQLISRSSCSLKKLVLKEAGIRVEDLHQCIQLTPDLRHLHLNLEIPWSEVAPGFMASLRPSGILHLLTPTSSPSPSLLPCLQEIVLNGISPEVSSDLLHFLRVRVRPPPGVIGLDACYLYFPESLDGDTRSEIAGIAAAGAARVTVYVPPPSRPAHNAWSGIERDRI